MRAIAALSGIAALVTAAVAFAGTTGTWKGRLIDPREQIPSSAYGSGTLVVGVSSVTARITNHTQAAHDPASATSTCVMRFRFAGVLAGWRYYAEVGRPALVSGTAAGGMPDLSMCSYTAISGGSAIRVRTAGSKLRVQYTPIHRSTWPGAALQGYLTRG